MPNTDHDYDQTNDSKKFRFHSKYVRWIQIDLTRIGIDRIPSFPAEVRLPT